MCEVANREFSQGLGCNISVSVSDATSAEDYASNVSPKRSGFLDSLLRRSPGKDKQNKSKDAQNWSIFAKKSIEEDDEKKRDERMAEFVAQLRLDGRSDAEIAMHLSFLHDVQPAPASPKKNRNLVSQWIQMIKDEFSLTEVISPYDLSPGRGMTVSISSAPFFGAPPPDMDMTYEELASLEPVYVGSKSINNLPTCKHDGTPLPGDQTTCTVCLCEFTKGEKLKSLPCVHFFHKECIDRWLMVGHACPMCKTLVE